MILVALFLPVIALLQAAAEAQAPQLEARVYAAHETIQPGGETDLAVVLEIPEDWYIYHPFILDTGVPTTVRFDLPSGASVGELRFPIPRLGQDGKQAYLGLDESVTILTKLRLAADAGPQPLQITATVRAPARDYETQQSAELEAEASLTLPVSQETPVAANEELFEDALFGLPQPLAEADYLKGSRLLVSHKQIPVGGEATVVAVIRVEPKHHIQDRDPGAEGLVASRLFIESHEGIRFSRQIWPAAHVREMRYFGKVREQSGEFFIQAPFVVEDPEFPPGPVRLRVLFSYQCCSDAGTCFPPNMAAGQVEFEVVPAGTAAVENDDPLLEKLAAMDKSSAETAGQLPASMLAVFLGAFLGGVILNVMPCVLPVISLKIFGFMQQAGDDRGRIFRMGLMYAAGIMASFAVLAVVVVSAGLAWGGLMQQPGFLIGLGAVLFAFALSMLGVFELRLPGAAMSAAGEASGKEGYGGAFVSGILATLIATPCVGPFLGSALGVLTLLPALIAGVGILVVGLGLAAPYVLLTAFPGWLRFVPKPGPWMVVFKQIVGFILVGVVIWLMWILSKLVESGTILGMLGLLLVVGIGCWLLGKDSLTGGRARTAKIWIAALVVMFGGGWGSFHVFAERASIIPWQAWEPGIGKRLVADGYTVYLDYTAYWCITCQTNKRFVLETRRVAAELKKLGVYPVKVDFTSYDKRIQHELQAYGRNAVPLNVVIPAGRPDEAIVLPELLRTERVLEALRQAGPSQKMPDFWLLEP